MFVLWADRKRTRYLVTMLPVAGLLTAFWTLPFLFGGAYMTDMTYERRPVGNAPNGLPDSYWQMLFPYAAWIDILVFALAAIGLIGCVIRGRRAGVFLGLVAVVFGTWACIWPQSHLWNARLLPFMYLARYLLAFIGVYEIVALVVRHLRLELRDGAARTANEDRRRRWGRRADGLASPTAQWGVGSGVLVGVVLASLIYGGIHFQRGLPFATFGVHNGKTTYDWLFFQGTKAAFVDDWAHWNYTGYEGKPTWNEYRSIMSTMQDIGQEQGCGRALWEHQTGNDVSSYGTPMALMLLPFFTDGCIGSMEGLYFEASGTTPYHFLTAAAGSKQASNPVRRLAYDNDNVELAVRYMQDLGIRYYMAFRPDVVAQADANPDLTPLRQVGPWTIYEVADSDLVVPLTTNPVVVKGVKPGELPLHLGEMRDRWLEIGTSWFQHPDDWAAVPADSGPSDWQRITVKPDGQKTDDRHLARVKPVEDRRCVDARPREGVERPDLGRLALLLGRQGRRAGARQDELLPELEGRRRQGPVPGGSQLHGRGPDLQPGHADLRHEHHRVPGLRAHPSRDRAALRPLAEGPGQVRARHRGSGRVAGRRAALARRARARPPARARPARRPDRRPRPLRGAGRPGLRPFAGRPRALAR